MKWVSLVRKEFGYALHVGMIDFVIQIRNAYRMYHANAYAAYHGVQH